MTPRDTRLDFEGLYRSHRQEVYRAALRKVGDHHEAEDVTQTAFLDAYRAVLRGSHPDLPRAWLFAIAENVRRRRFRTTLRRPPVEPLRDEALPSAEPPWRAQTEEIRAALSTLADSQRKAFLLRELGGYSYGEIAEQLDTSVPAVQMLLFRARQKLRTELDPSVRVGGLIPIPHWVLGLADRFSTGVPVPRVAGLVAAGVIAASVGVTSDVPVAKPKTQSAVPSRPAVQLATPVRAQAAAPPPKAGTLTARPAAVHAKQALRAAPRTRSAPTSRSQTPVAAQTPALEASVVSSSGAEPAAPAAPPATLGVDDRAPAPALVPALLPVSQAPIDPVVEALLPPLSELPVEDVPALPDLPIVGQPQLPPVLPGVVEDTVPAVAGLLIGP